jgi:protein-disulfide isomerase
MLPAEMPETRRRFLTGAFFVVGGLVLLGVAWFLFQTAAFYFDIQRGGFDGIEDRRLEASVSSLVANTTVTDEDLALLIPTGLYPERGPRNAPVTIVEFVDYQCPFCQRAAPAVRKVVDAYGDQVHLIIRDFPVTSLHPNAKRSAVAARCALVQGQDIYWRFHDLLYANAQAHTPENFRVWAQASGARVDAFTDCMADERVLTQIDRDIEAGLRVGVQGTPTFFVNGVRIQGALDEKLLSRVIAATLEKEKP